MNPKFLRNNEDFKHVASALSILYNNRPDSYSKYSSNIKFENYARIVKQYAKSNELVLDFGSGTWQLPYALRCHGLQVEGIDLWSDADLQKQLEQMPINGPKLSRYNGELLPYPDNYFDVVCSLNVFEHLINVDETLLEINRVLKIGGKIIILAPNWLTITAPIHALYYQIASKGRYWQFESIIDVLIGILRSLFLPIKLLLSRKSYFLYVFPRMEYGQIKFERSDDDVVHLSCPVSYKKWFKKHNYKILNYNINIGNGLIAKLFNYLFPDWATSVFIVAEKLKK